MARVLHIQASPRGWQSTSYRVAKAYLEALKQRDPLIGIETLNVFTADIPQFNAPEAAAKYAVLQGQEPADEASLAWQRVIEVINDFKSADAYVIATAMWNFSIPYRLKQYIDVIVQPGLTFSYSPTEGYKGLVTGKPVVLIMSRGGEYPTGTAAAPLDMQKPYLELILGYIGLTDIRSLIVEPTLASGQAVADQKIKAACELARSMAAELTVPV